MRKSLLPRFLITLISILGTSRGVSGWSSRQIPLVLSPRSPTSTATLYQAKKQKLSMAEKRKRRAKRLPPKPVIGKPVDFSKNRSSESNTASSAQKEMSPANNAPKTVDDEPPSSEQRAKELIEAQRKSVDMLTLVRKRVESLPKQQMQESLSTKGYFVKDDFLNDDEIINELKRESSDMLENDQMDLDLENLGYGEYTASIKGEEEQYAQCPRLVEFVVSITKHFPDLVSDHVELDSSACMATLRSFSHKTRLASLELVQGSGRIEKEQVQRVRPFGVISIEPEDARRLTVLYYPISKEWNGSAVEGGVTFEDSNENVRARRDRLVMLASDSCRHRRDAWMGRDGLYIASCIELHFLLRRNSQ